MAGAMQTPDGAWVVEIYRQPRSRSFWYRLIHGENVVESLTIASVERLLTEAGYDIADLIDVPTPGSVTEHRDDEIA